MWQSIERKRSWYLDPISSKIEKGLFISLAIIGAILIVVLRVYEINPFFIMVLAASLIVIYAFVSLFVKRFYLREDRIADNAYYLGFIYTLISLSYALYQFETGAEATNQLIQDFGIALISTITGIIVRLILSQFRADPVETERESRYALSEAARALHTELNQAVVDTNTYIRTLHQSMDEAMSNASDRANKSITETTEKFEEVANTILTRLESTFSEYDSNAQRLNEISSKTAEAIQEVVSRIETIEAPSNLLSSKLEPAIDQITQATVEINRRASAEGRELKRLSQLVETTSNSTESMNQQIEHVINEQKNWLQITAELDRAITDLKNTSEQTQKAVQSHTESLGTLSKEAHNNIQNINQYNSDMQSALNESKDMTLQVHSELVELSKLLIERLGNHSGQQPSDDHYQSANSTV